MRSKIFFEQIFNLDNLFYAWKKAKYIYDYESDFIFQIEELAEFEANLHDNLKDISRQIEQCTYHLAPMIPLWLPKASAESEDRQHFVFSVRDQVVWIAVINVIGPILDNAMPYWSFGNRLYMPIWKEHEKELQSEQSCKINQKITRFGYYSTSSPKLYRNWSSSWPLFRKAVSISVKSMIASTESYTKEELEDIEMYEDAPKSFKIECWDSQYWNPGESIKDVYYASIDLKKFYPSINNEKILSPMTKDLLGIKSDNDSLKILIENLLKFYFDPDSLPSSTPKELLIGIDEKTGTFSGIPTGLFTAGFLANIAMLPVDDKVYHMHRKSCRIGHFRFVDDHVFIAYDFDELCNWIKQYEKVLKENFHQLVINSDKIEPVELKGHINSLDSNKRSVNDEVKAKACIACKLDTRLPSPFTTLTLRKLSNINASPFDLLDEAGKKELLSDVEHILATDFPDDEIRKDTRVSWAASIMIRLVPSIETNIQEQYDKREALEFAFLRKKGKDSSSYIDEKENEYMVCKDQISSDNEKTYRHIFFLLIKALVDNIAKPKLWKKCITYCCATGFSGIPRLLQVLKEDPMLTHKGKEYIFSTLIEAITENVMRSINIKNSSYYTSKEKDSANKFVKEIFALKKEIVNVERERFHSKYSEKVLRGLIVALSLYDLECNNKQVVIDIDYSTICFLWIYLPIYIRHVDYVHTPAIIDYLSKNSKSHANNTIYKKILLMFPDKLSKKIRDEISGNLLSPQQTRERQSGKRTHISLQKLFIYERIGGCPHSFDVLRSEWTALKIMQKILACVVEVGKDKKINSIKDQNIIELPPFINCAPCNFYIDKDILNCNLWGEIQEFLNNHPNPIVHKPVCLDYRFDSGFYNRAGIAYERRQIYSCSVLLIVLLSGSMRFNPLVGRSSFFDRNYKLLLGKLSNVPVSSYTRAILVGAMSDKWFELQNYTALDMPEEGRTKTHQDSPVAIDTIKCFIKEIDGAIETLENYQLSLQNQTPRQLIPVSLKNLTKDYNPYTKAGEADGNI